MKEFTRRTEKADKKCYDQETLMPLQLKIYNAEVKSNKETFNAPENVITGLIVRRYMKIKEQHSHSSRTG